MKSNELNSITSEEAAPPLTCTLSCRELKKRKATIFAALNKKRVSKTELANGYCFDFVMNEEIEKQIAFFIEEESKCCSFLDFHVMKDVDNKVLTLKVEGPDNVKSFVDLNINI